MKVENKPRWFQRLDDNGDVVFDLTKVLKASLIFVLSFFILMSCSVFMISYWGHPKIMSANEVGDAFVVANAFFFSSCFFSFDLHLFVAARRTKASTRRNEGKSPSI